MKPESTVPCQAVRAPLPGCPAPLLVRLLPLRPCWGKRAESPTNLRRERKPAHPRCRPANPTGTRTLLRSFRRRGLSCQVTPSRGRKTNGASRQAPHIGFPGFLCPGGRRRPRAELSSAGGARSTRRWPGGSGHCPGRRAQSAEQGRQVPPALPRPSAPRSAPSGKHFTQGSGCSRRLPRRAGPAPPPGSPQRLLPAGPARQPQAVPESNGRSRPCPDSGSRGRNRGGRRTRAVLRSSWAWPAPWARWPWWPAWSRHVVPLDAGKSDLKTRCHCK